MAERTGSGFDILNDKERARAHAEKVRVVKTETAPEPAQPKSETTTATETVSTAPNDPTPPVAETTEPSVETATETLSSSEPESPGVVEVTEEQVLKIGDREVPVKELLGKEKLLARKDRKIAKLEPLAERARQMDERKPTDDPEPTITPEYQPGDPEHTAHLINHALWKQRQDIKPILDFASQVAESEKIRTAQYAESQERLGKNNATLAEYTEYAPFDYTQLPDEKKAEFNQLVVSAAAKRGLIISGANANIAQYDLTSHFVENIVRDALDGFQIEPPRPTISVKTTPVVAKSPPKSPIVPLPNAAPVSTPARRESRRNGQAYSIESAIAAKSQ